jgi:uncharacterized protein (TIGR02757 family)
MNNLKQTLDRFYREYNFNDCILHDPIEFPHQYKRPEDIEVSGFIASCFAYGRVDLFKPVIKRILSIMGESPYDFLVNFNLKRHGHLFSGIKYRFNENEDILCLLYVLSRALKKYGSIESLFKLHYKESDFNTGNGLTGLVETMTAIDLSHPPLNPLPSREGKSLGIKTNYPSPCGRGRGGGDGFLQFFPSPKKGSACKRMNLFLRWMIRDRDIDFGIWKGIPKNKLVIPLDTHIARISKCLAFTKRSSQDWKMAVEITGALKRFDSEDPLKYDFALCHHGISRVCSKMSCKECGFFNR